MQEIESINDYALSCKVNIEIYTTKVNSQRVYISFLVWNHH
jgi:hypothetical protein